MSHTPPCPEHRSRLVLLFILATLTACSGKNGSGTDSSTDGSTDGLDDTDGTGPAPPALPEAPAPPVLTPCPDGWREVEDPDTGAVTCDPWPEGGAHECADDEAHFPGEPGCTTIGTPCGTGDWATDLPTDRTIIYVRAGEPSGGDGSETAPYATIAEAMGDASPGDVVAVSKGTFEEIVAIAAGVTLWGACTAETEITSSVPADTSGTVIPARSDAEVRNLTITGERNGVFNNAAGRTMAITGVVIRNTRMNGVYNTGEITMRDVAIRNIRGSTTLADRGMGINVLGGGVADISRVVVEGSRVVGVYAGQADTSITARDLVVRGTLPSEDSLDFGYGLVVQEGATGVVERAWIEANRTGGIHVHHGASLQASDIVVRDSRACELDGTLGRGIMVETDSALQLSRAHIDFNRDAGIMLMTSSQAVVSDIVITDTQRSTFDDMSGFGIAMMQASDLEVTRAILDGNHHAGFASSGAGTTMTLVDVSVYRTQVARSESVIAAAGIWASSGSEATITRAHLEGNVRTGMRLNGLETSVTVLDLTILETTGIPEFNSGFGLWIFDGAHATIERVLIENNRDLGVSADGDGTELTLTDAVIKDTRSQDGTGLWGRGLQAIYGAHIYLTRTVLEHNRELGLSVVHPGTDVIGTDVVIRDTIERGCASSTCEGRGHGCGISALGEAHVDLTSFLITGNVLCGLQICYGWDPATGLFAIGGQVDLHDGAVSDHPIGVNIQTSDYEIERLMDNVLYFDNDTNLDSYDLPVPDMATSGL